MEVVEKETTEVVEDYKTKYLYAMADLDNVRKQANKRISDATTVADEKFVKELLPVVDDFERANSSENVPDGVIMVYKKLLSILNARGVEKIPSVGTQFDLNVHEAIAEIPSDTNGVVMDCIQDGYAMNGKVIRYAKVVVGKTV